MRYGGKAGSSLLVRLKQLIERLCMEFVVAEIQGGIYGFERLKVNIELLFLAIVRHDGSCVDDQSIGGHLQLSSNLAITYNLPKRSSSL